MRRELQPFYYPFTESTTPVPDYNTEQDEQELRQIFLQEAAKILASEDYFVKSEKRLRAGLEVEYAVLDSSFQAVSESTRDALVAQTDVDGQHTSRNSELGAAQIELRTDPHYIQDEGITGIKDDLEYHELSLRKSIRESQKGYLLRLGANPLVPINQIVRSSKVTSVKIPNYHDSKRRSGQNTIIGRTKTVDISTAAIMGISNSVQCTVEASDFTDAVDKMNRAFAIGPMTLALAGNSRFYEGKDIGVSDARMETWELSHDARTWDEISSGIEPRVGLPFTYYQDLTDYFNRIPQYPFIIKPAKPEDVLGLGIGLHWRDSRVKFPEGQNSVVVEFRPPSAQRTPFENTAIMAFYIGRLAWSQQNNEALLDLSLVRENRTDAMHHGLRGGQWTQLEGMTVLLSTTEALAIELQRARDGLEREGIAQNEIEEYIGHLEESVTNKTNPSDKLSRIVNKQKEHGIEDSSEVLIMAMNENGNLIS